MAKTYQLKALWPLLPFEVAAAPLLATLDAYGGGLVKYAVTQDGIWLFSPSQPLTVHESENLTGFHPADLVPKQIDGVEGYFYALQGGAPLLPLPFTKDQLIAFDKRTAGLIGSCIERGDDTDAWITDLEKDNPDAAKLARGIHGGKWLLDLADIVDTKTDGAAKPRFRLADGIEPDASAMAFKSAFDEVQRQKDMLKNMGITPDLLKQIDYQKEMEKLVGGSAGSLANAGYMDELKRNQDMLRVMNPSASELAAEALGRQLVSTVGFDTAASAYRQNQSTTRAEIEKAMGGNIGTAAEAMRQHEALGYANTVADVYRQAQYPQQTELEKITAMVGGSVANSLGQLDRAGLDAAMGRYHQPTASEMFEQMERERIEKANEDAERRLNTIEVPRIHFYDHRADEDRRLERERKHKLETARLEEITRQEVRDEYEARKQAASPTPASNVTPVVSKGAPVGAENENNGPGWTLTTPKRFQGYGKPLFDYLKGAHSAGKPCPTARNVLDDWKLNRPADVAEVSNDGLKYYDASGNTKPADLAAIRKAIERMTT